MWKEKGGNSLYFAPIDTSEMFTTSPIRTSTCPARMNGERRRSLSDQFANTSVRSAVCYDADVSKRCGRMVG